MLKIAKTVKSDDLEELGEQALKKCLVHRFFRDFVPAYMDI